jgi:hypothetical protein
MPAFLMADVDFNSIDDNSWIRQPRASGNQGFGSGGDVHAAFDNSGLMYIFGGCTSYNGAGGSHNADIYRIDIKTGWVDRIANCSSGWWRGGCQAGQTYDSKRNCVWVSGGLQPTCSSGPGGGMTLWKFHCPNGPMVREGEKPSSGYGTGCIYMYHDPVNDLIYCPQNTHLDIYNCQTEQWKLKVGYPFTGITSSAIPCCVDRKRGLFVITLAAKYTISNPATDIVYDVWFYNGANGIWQKKSPATKPQFYKSELAYDVKNDKYVYFGVGRDKCNSEVWTYDYNSNTWTEMARGNRSYDDNNQASSTWAPGRTKHSWAYCAKYNVFANYGGGNWINMACSDIAEHNQPLWIYRLANGSTTKVVEKDVKPKQEEGVLSVSPNPFNSAVQISLANGRGVQLNAPTLAIYDTHGRIVHKIPYPNLEQYTWNPSNLPRGIYIVRLKTKGQSFSKRIMLQ